MTANNRRLNVCCRKLILDLNICIRAHSKERRGWLTITVFECVWRKIKLLIAYSNVVFIQNETKTEEGNDIVGCEILVFRSSVLLLETVTDSHG